MANARYQQQMAALLAQRSQEQAISDSSSVAVPQESTPGGHRPPNSKPQSKAVQQKPQNATKAKGRSMPMSPEFIVHLDAAINKFLDDTGLVGMASMYGAKQIIGRFSQVITTRVKEAEEKAKGEAESKKKADQDAPTFHSILTDEDDLFAM